MSKSDSLRCLEIGATGRSILSKGITVIELEVWLLKLGVCLDAESLDCDDGGNAVYKASIETII